MAENESTDFSSAVADFRGALQHTWSSPEAEQQIVQAYRRYSTTLLQAWQTREIFERASETYADYLRKVRAVFTADEEWAGIDKAFRQYVEDLKQAWVSADPESMSLEEMIAIADGMTWVTGVVRAIRQAREKKP